MSNANANPTGSFGPEQAEDIRRQFIQRAPEGSASAALDAGVLACFDSAGYGRHPKVLSLLEALHANKDLTEVRKLKKAAYQLLDAAQFVDGSQERKVKNAVATAIDAASDRLIDVLDQSGALESERVQRAAYQLRLAVVQAIGDPGRISAAEQSLRELDGEGAKTLPHPSGPGCDLIPDDFPPIIVGREYEFYAEMQQAKMPEHDRMRNYTSQTVTVTSGPLPKDDDEGSDLFRVRTADGREFEAFDEELSGWNKALGQYFWPDGTYGPDRDKTYLVNEKKMNDGAPAGMRQHHGEMTNYMKPTGESTEGDKTIQTRLRAACEHKIALHVDAAIDVVDTEPTQAESLVYEAGQEAWEFDIQVPDKLHPFPVLSAAFRRGFDEVESHSQRQRRLGADPFDQSQHEHDRPRGG